MTAPGRILLVGVNWLGDALLSTPAVRAVRRAHPGAHLEILVPERVRAVFARNPHVDGVIVYADRAPVASPAFWKTVRLLQAGRFDAAIFFHGSRTKARMARWAGIPERWGADGRGKSGLLTRTAPPAERGTHRAQIYLDLAAAFGIPSDGRKIDFVPEPSAEASLNARLAALGLAPGRPYAAVHAGGNWELKRWPAGHFRRWIRLFLDERPDAAVVLCGTAAEAARTREIAEGFDPSRVTDAAGKTSLDELAFLFRKALFVLSNDSGPIHLAASQDAPLVGLFGPTSPAETGPWTQAPARILWRDPGCQIPCYFRACGNRVCLERLTPEDVAAAAKAVRPA